MVALKSHAWCHLPHKQLVKLARRNTEIVEPVTLVGGVGMRQVTLSQHAELTELLDRADGLIEKLETDGIYQCKEWRVLRRYMAAYEGGRMVYKCLAMRMTPGKATIKG